MKHKFLKLIFYHHYVCQEKVGNADIAPFSTIVYMGFVTYFNLMWIYSLLSLFCPSIKSNISNWFIPFVLITIIFYFLLEYKYNYKRMIALAKVLVGKKGKILWIICIFIMTILEPLVVCTLWWANNNGYIDLALF
ncbi:MAG: hypothetical protein J6V54_02115 [Bacteroidales bacterium]|nr:hypothetical protein [Bacteroidales bacterium]